MTALEMQFSILSVVRRISKMADVPKSVTDRHVMLRLQNSTPFSWSAETVSAVWMASKSIPKDAAFDIDLIPEGVRNAWWWLDGQVPLPMKHPSKRDVDDIGDTEHICGILMSLETQDNGSAWTISCARKSSMGVPFMTEINHLPVGVALSDLAHPDTTSFDPVSNKEEPVRPRDIALFRFVLAAATWLKQRIAITHPGHIERHRRKQLAREYDFVMSDVKVVQLRRVEPQTHEHDPNVDSVEWSCRWIVGGHWRNQYHPSTGKHELKYILPYVKGPADKPLKVPTHTVYEVSR